MRKRICAVLLCFCMLAATVTGIPFASVAAETPVAQIKVGSTVLSASNPSMTAGSGTVTFDASTGTLTLNNATGVGSIYNADSTAGDLKVICKGTNTLAATAGFAVSYSVGKLTFGGDGSLDMSGGMGVYCVGGDLIVTDSLTLTVSITGNNYTFGTRYGNDIVFEKNCKVTLNGHWYVLFHNTFDGTQTLEIRDSADVTVNSDANEQYAVKVGLFRQSGGRLTVNAQNAGADAFYCTGYVQTGGDLSITLEGNTSKTKVEGIYIDGGDTAIANFNGGTLSVDISSACENANAVHAIYLHHVADARFCGTDVSLKVSTPKAGPFSSAILTGWTQKITLSGGKITADLDANTTGLINPRLSQDYFVLEISGGKLLGTAPSLLNTSIGSDGSGHTTAVTVNVLTGAEINLATPGGVFSSAGQYTVDVSGSTAEFDEGCGLVATNVKLVTKGAGPTLPETPVAQIKVGSTILNASNPSMTAGSGTVTFDPSAGTLTLDNATGVGSIYNADSTPGDLKVICKGTNTLVATSAFAVSYSVGTLIFGGDGSLAMSGSMGVYCVGGDLIATDSLTMTITTSGNNYTFGTRNSNDVVFEKNCKVTLNGRWYVLFHNTFDGTQTLEIRDSADVTVNSDANEQYAVKVGLFRQTGGRLTVNVQNAGADAFYCTGYTQTGGDLSITLEGNTSKTKVEGIYIDGGDTGIANFSGGTLSVDISSACENANAVHAIYLHHVADARFCGTDVSLKVSTPKAGPFSSAILTGWTQKITLSGGKITADLDANTTGLINPRLSQDYFVLEISGGKLLGTAPSLLNTSIGSDGSGHTTAVTVNVLTGAEINLATPGGVFSSAGQYTVDVSGSTASFAEGCGLVATNVNLITADSGSSDPETPAAQIKVGSTILSESNPSMTAGSGTVTFDPSAGTLTLDNATGIGGIASVSGTTGDLKVICKGTNTLAVTSGFAVNYGVGKLTFGGDGSLAVASGSMGVYCTGGDLIVTDSLTLSVSITGANYAFGTKNNYNIIFEKNCNVTLTGQGRVIFHNTVAASSTHKLLVQDAAHVSVISENTADGDSIYAVYCAVYQQTGGTFDVTMLNAGAQSALCCTGYEQTGGDLSIKVEGNTTKNKVQGLHIVGNDTAVPMFAGGTLSVEVSSARATADAIHAIYLHHVADARFCGTDVSLKVSTPKAGPYSSAILTGWTHQITLSGGTITADLDNNTTGLINPRYAQDYFVLQISGGKLTGTAPSFLNTGIGSDGNGYTTAVTVNVLTGAQIHLSTPGGVFSSAGQYTVDVSGSTASFAEGCGLVAQNEYLITSNMFETGNWITVDVTDKNETVTLNFGRRTYNGIVGQILLDPEAGVLTLDGVRGPASVSASGNVTVNVIGTCEIADSSGSAFSANGTATFVGDGKLTLSGASSVLQATAVTVDGPEVRVAALTGPAAVMTDLTAKGTADVRFLAETGTALVVDGTVTVTDGSCVQIYADNGDGLQIDGGAAEVSGDASLTVIAGESGIVLNDAELRMGGASLLEVFADALSDGGAAVTLNQGAQVRLSGHSTAQWNAADGAAALAVAQNTTAQTACVTVEGNAVLNLTGAVSVSLKGTTDAFALVVLRDDSGVIRGYTDAAGSQTKDLNIVVPGIFFHYAGAAENSAVLTLGNTLPAAAFVRVVPGIPSLHTAASDEIIADADAPVFEIAGAQVRTTAPNGIRFVARIGEDLISALEAQYGAGNVKYGILLQRVDSVTGSLTMDSVSSTALSAGGAAAVEGVYTFRTVAPAEANDGYRYYTAVITGMTLKADLMLDIAARGYIAINDNGTMRYIYTEEADGATYPTGAYSLSGAYCVSTLNVADYIIRQQQEGWEAVDALYGAYLSD